MNVPKRIGHCPEDRIPCISSSSPLRSALLIGTAAAAEPIEVEYLTDRSAFKSLSATDVLEFGLFEDADCSVQIGTYPLLGSDASTRFFVDKLQRVRGAARAPKAIRIHAIIDAPVMAQAPYLRVTGPGIKPVGDECQLAGNAEATCKARCLSW